MNKLIARLPDGRSIIGVYSAAVFLVYGWTLLASFWKVPSWLFYLKVGELLSIYAYALAVNFAESLILLVVMVLPGLILPKSWWNARFKTFGTLWITVLMGSIMIRLYTNRAPEYWEDFVYNQWGWWGYTLLLGIVLSFLFTKFSLLRNGLEALVDRLVVFLYLYLPLTVVAILVLIVRIIF
jgi:hypothetical protein